MAVHFYSQDILLKLKHRIPLKNFLHQLFLWEAKNLVGLDYIFCSDQFLYTLNRDFLNHHTYTDVLTFDLSLQADQIQGEIYISLQRVKENAVKFGANFENELHRVIFHGALHLCGYQDKSPGAKKIMRNKEDHYLKKYFDSP
ncbi:MAG: rRNA maturation RNase YbeY [Chitinophagaceae bacterium]